MVHLGRRELLGGALAASALLALPRARAADVPLTPPNPLGPYFRAGAPLRKRLVEKGDVGLPVVVTGTILDAGGAPLEGLRLDVFHADPRGTYDMRGFRYRARVPVAADGGYELETLMPGHYIDAAINPDAPRPEHIHFRVERAGQRPFATQLYFQTDPFFESDVARTLAKDPLVRHAELVRPVQLVAVRGRRHAAVRFDLHLGPAA